MPGTSTTDQRIPFGMGLEIRKLPVMVGAALIEPLTG